MSVFRFLFAEYLCHGSAYPCLRLFQPEDAGNGRSRIKLHHGFLECSALFYVFPGNDERNFHFGKCYSPVTFVDAPMVGGQDNNRIIIDTRIFQCGDDPLNINAQLIADSDGNTERFFSV